MEERRRVRRVLAADETKRVRALVEFYVAMPTTEAEAEKRVEEIEAVLVAAVNDLSLLGVFDESARLIGWTEHNAGEVAREEGGP
jgi:hypothetical protein